MVNAEEYVVINVPERRPVGLIRNVHHTCLDLRVPRLLKKAFPLIPGFGYNHTFKLFKGKEKKAFNLAARYYLTILIILTFLIYNINIVTSV